MSQSQVRISVIIPVFNGEKTIERAVRSVAGLIDSEIIVAENGSNDKTTEIVESLSKELNNVVLLHSAKGVSAARNAALKAARGEWIAFVDADDFIDETGISWIEDDYIQGSCDLYLYGHWAGNEERPVAEIGEFYSPDNVIDARVRMIDNPTKYMQVWGKLFRNSIIKANNLLFNEKLHFSEDSEFTLKYSRFCERIKFSDKMVYRYSVYQSSVMRSFEGNKTEQYKCAMEETSKVIADEDERIKNAFNKYILMHLNIAMVREIYAVNNPADSKAKKNAMKKLISEEIFSNSIRKIKVSQCFVPRLLPVLFFKMKLAGISAFIYKVRARQNYKREG